MYTRVSGVWKQVNELHTRVSGTWKEVTRGFTQVSGVWKEFYGGFVTVTNITESNTQAGTPAAVCGVRFNRDGSIDVVKGRVAAETFTAIHAGEWWNNEPDSDIGDRYQVRCASVTTGDPNTLWSPGAEAAPVGTYITMSSGRIWQVNAPGAKNPGFKAITVSSFEIRHVTEQVVLDTFNVSVTATRT